MTQESLEQRLIRWRSATEPKLLDLRSEVNQSDSVQPKPRNYIKGSTCIPFENFESRFCELPTKAISFSILIDGIQDEFNHIDLLKSRGWIIDDIFISNSEFWEACKILDLLTFSIDGKFNYTELLFSPCPFLKLKYDEIVTGLINSGIQEWSVIDVGCGSGRDLAWLGKKDKRALINGIDSLKFALIRTSTLFGNLKIKDRLRHLLRIKFHAAGTFRYFYGDNESVQLKEISELATFLKSVNHAEAPFEFSLVICVRYLEKSSFKHLRNMVKVNGYILYSTFVELGENHVY